jgi:hypothetical protein
MKKEPVASAIDLKNEKVKEFFFPSGETRKELEIVRNEIEKIYRKELSKDEFDKLVKRIESVIRNMPEYKRWVSIRGSEENYCQLCGVPFEETGLKREVHHTPFTLYELVASKIEERLNSEEPIKTEEIIEDVINEHLENNVPSVVLCKCCHKRLHYERKEYGNEVSLETKLRELYDDER